jgi:glycosyltransferase involved in cell wall biosynthesis
VSEVLVKSICLAILTHNEIQEFRWLMEEIGKRRTLFQEILVVDDFSTNEMVREIFNHKVSFHQRALNKNFSGQRNYLKSLCKTDFLFMMDADELPTPSLIEALPEIVGIMDSKNIDAVSVPRLSVVHDKEDPVDARTITFSEADPREQLARIIRNVAYLKFTNPVHERLVGVRRQACLPNKLKYSIFHVKGRSRCLEQRAFYKGIGWYDPRQLAKKVGLKPLAKRLGFLSEPEWVDISELTN